NAIPDMLRAAEAAGKTTDVRFSLGMIVKEDGALLDVIPGSPAAQSGVSAAMKLLAVNGRRWNAEILRAAIRSAQTIPPPHELVLKTKDHIKPSQPHTHDGEKYPSPVRHPNKPNLLEAILKPLPPPPPEAQ